MGSGDEVKVVEYEVEGVMCLTFVLRCKLTRLQLHGTCSAVKPQSAFSECTSMFQSHQTLDTFLKSSRYLKIERMSIELQ